MKRYKMSNRFREEYEEEENNIDELMMYYWIREDRFSSPDFSNTNFNKLSVQQIKHLRALEKTKYLDYKKQTRTKSKYKEDDDEYM